MTESPRGSEMFAFGDEGIRGPISDLAMHISDIVIVCIVSQPEPAWGPLAG